jgi:hypothetical protein
MKRNIFLLLVMIFISMNMSSSVVAHDGAVDEDGCHLDAKGRKHCH